MYSDYEKILSSSTSEYIMNIDFRNATKKHLSKFIIGYLNIESSTVTINISFTREDEP